MTLTHPTATILLDLADYGLTAADTSEPADWRNISAYEEGWSVTGTKRRRLIDRYQPGRAVVTLNNEADPVTGRPFTHTNTSGPFYPSLRPRRRLRIGHGYAPLVFGDVPLLHWRLGEAVGAGITADEMGPFDGTAAGGVTFGSSGRIPGNTSADFDGATGVIDNTSFTAPLTSAWTLEAWIQADSAAALASVVTKGLITQRDVALGVDATSKPFIEFVATTGSAQNVTAAAGITADGSTWHHLVGTWDGTTLRLYVDGEATGTPLAPGLTVRDTGDVIRAGGPLGAGGGQFDGRLDEIAVYDRALTAAEVAAHYDEGISGFRDRWEFTGFVRGWPRSWRSANDDQVTITADDGASWLERVELSSPWAYETREINWPALTPALWWRLGETSGTRAVDSSDNGYHLTYEGGVTFNTRASLVFDDDDPAIFFEYGVGDKATGLAAVPAVPFSIEFLFQVEDASTTAGGLRFILNSYFQTDPGRGVDVWMNNSGQIALSASDTTFYTTTTTAAFNDGELHHCIATMAGPTDIDIYIDGVAQTVTNNGAGATNPSGGLMKVTLGNNDSPVAVELGFDGVLDEFIVHDFAISSAQAAGRFGDAVAPYDGELSGSRAVRLLNQARWPHADRSIDVGVSTLQAATHNGKRALAALAEVGDTEGIGAFYFDELGRAVLVDRDTIWTVSRRTISQAAFGSTDDGRLAFHEQLDIDFSDDDLGTRATVQRRGRSQVVVEDTTASAGYGLADISKTGLGNDSDDFVTDFANWLPSVYGTPADDIPQIRIAPGVDTDLWNEVLDRRIGDRITVYPPDGSDPIEASVEGRDVSREGAKARVTYTLCRALVGAFVLDVSELDSADTIAF